MRLIVTHDSNDVCEIWKSSVNLMLNKLGMFVPKRQGDRVVRITPKLCRGLFGFVPRKKTAKMVVVSPLSNKVAIRKQILAPVAKTAKAENATATSPQH